MSPSPPPNISRSLLTTTPPPPPPPLPLTPSRGVVPTPSPLTLLGSGVAPPPPPPVGAAKCLRPKKANTKLKGHHKLAISIELSREKWKELIKLGSRLLGKGVAWEVLLLVESKEWLTL